jgi:hypothetical protein
MTMSVQTGLNFEIRGDGGLYPEGCAFTADTANGAIERYHAVRTACGKASVHDHRGRRLSSKALMSLAEAELAKV